MTAHNVPSVALTEALAILRKSNASFSGTSAGMDARVLSAAHAAALLAEREEHLALLRQYLNEAKSAVGAHS